MSNERSPWLRTTTQELKAQADALGVHVEGRATAKALWHAIMVHLDDNPDVLTDGPVQRPDLENVTVVAHETVISENLASEVGPPRWIAPTLDPDDRDPERECVACGVIHECNRCGKYRGNDQEAHDSPLCAQCDSELYATQPPAEVVGPAADIVAFNPSRFPTLQRWTQIEQMAARLFGAQMVRRKGYNTVEDVVCVLLAANDLGISSTMAMQQIHVIEGKPTLSAQLMVALVRQAGYSILPQEMSSERAIAVGKRGDEQASFEFTMDEARAAGLANKDNWRHYPKAMLWARAVSGLCRIMFPDVLAGLTYTPEELGATVNDEGDVIDVESWDTARDRVWAEAQQTTEPTQITDNRIPTDCEEDGEHDDSGVCCRMVIQSRIQLLPDDVRAALRDEWHELSQARQLRGLMVLRESDRGLVAELLNAAEQSAGPVPGAEHPDDEEAIVRVMDTLDAEIIDTPDVTERARAIVEEAAARPCPACGQPLNVENAKCKEHPFS